MAYIVMAYIVMAMQGAIDDGFVTAADWEECRSTGGNNFSGHADGERRGLDRIGGQHLKGLVETLRSAPSAVSMPPRY